MTEMPSANSPEKSIILEDNARKFTVDAVHPEFLHDYPVTSFTLTVDWLETGEDNETKVAYKQFDNGEIQILLIAKQTIDGNRTADKKEIDAAAYETLLRSSVRHLEKKRHEFDYTQNNISFAVKFDEFTDSDLRVLEVDAVDEEQRSAFDLSAFPVPLKEVTGDIRYYGYRVTDII